MIGFNPQARFWLLEGQTRAQMLQEVPNLDGTLRYDDVVPVRWRCLSPGSASKDFLTEILATLSKVRFRTQEFRFSPAPQTS
jgi:hypothetical protein